MKYGSTKVSHAGYSFASKAEAGLFDLLSLLERAGEIRNLKCQDTVYLTEARIQYRADFTAWDIKLEQQVWYEFKGFETDAWRIKRRLWMHYGPGILKVYKGRAGAIRLHEELKPILV